MARFRRRFGLLVGGLAVLGIVGFAGWWFFIRDDAPPPADIETASETLDEAAGADGGELSDDDGSSNDGGAADVVDGSWSVDQGVGSFDEFSGTYAGYRFQEVLANIGGNTAVGRTPDVTGSMTVAGDEVTAVDVEVDLTTLESDNGTRDRSLGSRGLESDRFPTATFSLTEPLPLPAGVADRKRVTASATGDLTIHGVTNQVTIELEAELQSDTAVVVGSAPVALADYDIDPPTGFSVLSIDDQGTFEFQLFFAKG